MTHYAEHAAACQALHAADRSAKKASVRRTVATTDG